MNVSTRDKQLNAFRDLAIMMKSYYDLLCKEKFSKSQALQIVIGYQSDINRAIHKSPNEQT